MDQRLRINQLESILKLVLLAAKKEGQFSLEGLEGEEKKKRMVKNWTYVLHQVQQSLDNFEQSHCQIGGIIFNYLEEDTDE